MACEIESVNGRPVIVGWLAAGAVARWMADAGWVAGVVAGSSLPLGAAGQIGRAHV